MALSTALGSHLSELNAVIATLTRGLLVPEVGSGLDIRTSLHFRSGLTTQLARFRENFTYSLHMMSDRPHGLTLEDDFSAQYIGICLRYFIEKCLTGVLLAHVFVGCLPNSLGLLRIFYQGADRIGE